jgi:hypothetical protein
MDAKKEIRNLEIWRKTKYANKCSIHMDPHITEEGVDKLVDAVRIPLVQRAEM